MINKLLKLREKIGLSQNKIAKLLGLHQGSVSKLESGVHYPSIETAKKYIEIATKRGIKLKLSDIYK
jgi:DNA-binding XRE family transcriptional regulator